MNRKPIFDRLRAMLGRGLSAAEVAAMDAAIESAMLPDAPSEPERSDVPGRTGMAGVALIKQFEGCRLEAYPDPGTGGEPWTIGWGATRIDGQKIQPGKTITQAQADALLLENIESHARGVVRALGSAINATSQAQFDALVSFHFNTGAIANATLTRKHVAGDFEGAAREFRRWTHSGGAMMKGLVRRRAAEEALYRRGM